MLTNFSAAIFDMDGLLLDSEPLAKQAFDTVCEQYGLPDQSDLFMQFVGTNTDKGNAIIQASLGDLIDVVAFNVTWRSLYGEWVKDKAVPLKEGVIEVLDYFQSQQIPMAVATSSKTDIAVHKLSKSGVLDYFDRVIGGDQVEKSKPEPDIFLKAAEALSCEPNRCIAFEDSPNGVRSALSAGMSLVQVPDLLTPDKALLAMGHTVLTCISDVINIDLDAVEQIKRAPQ
jgi:HAD superfamily hydrolase (TIGR01509 family)